MTTVQRRGLTFSGSTKYDKGYLRPRILDGPGGDSVIYGDGAPISNPGPGNVFYLDETNGDIYVNQGGAWVLYTHGSVSGVTGVYTWGGVGSKPTATGSALLIGTDGTSEEGNIWRKTTAGTNNTDWVQL